MFKIIHIEDNKGDALLTKDSFNEINAEIEITNLWDGQEAVKYFTNDLTKEKIDLILLDLNLPKIKGFEVIKSIKALEKYAHIPVVCLTTSSSSSDINEMVQLGATAYLIKPISITDLNKLTESIYNFWSLNRC